MNEQYTAFVEILGALGKLIVIAAVLERVLAFVFEYEWFVRLTTRVERQARQSRVPGLKAGITLAVSLAICFGYRFDILHVLFRTSAPQALGMIVTGLVVAGGSAGAIAIFQGYLNWGKQSRDTLMAARSAEALTREAQAREQTSQAQKRAALADAEKQSAVDEIWRQAQIREAEKRAAVADADKQYAMAEYGRRAAMHKVDKLTSAANKQREALDSRAPEPVSSAPSAEEPSAVSEGDTVAAKQAMREKIATRLAAKQKAEGSPSAVSKPAVEKKVDDASKETSKPAVVEKVETSASIKASVSSKSIETESTEAAHDEQLGEPDGQDEAAVAAPDKTPESPQTESSKDGASSPAEKTEPESKVSKTPAGRPSRPSADVITTRSVVLNKPAERKAPLSEEPAPEIAASSKNRDDKAVF